MYIQRSSYWPVSGPFPGNFTQALKQLLDDTDNASDVVTSEWAPRVDIREEDQRFVIEADVPGVDPQDIEVNMDNGVLSIRGERKDAAKTGDGKYARIERGFGTFHRRFALPDSVDPAGVRATGKFGVLEIEIPKRPEMAPRKIAIRSA